MPKDDQAGTAIRLLGGFDVLGPDGVPIAISGRKTRALLAILCLSPDFSSTRNRLIALLWSDRGEKQARNSFRQALTALRRELGERGRDILAIEGDQVGLRTDRVFVDAVEFDRLAAAGKAAEAVSLYRGPLLDDHGVRDKAFEEWAAGERRRLAERAIDAHETLLRETPTAERVGLARRLLALDSFRESAHRSLMQAFAAAGERDQALRQYETCRRMLREEFGVQPEAATGRLYEEISGQTTGTEPLNDAAPARFAGVNTEPPGVQPAPGGIEIDIRDKPTIAVLPFINMSRDPAQEYFSDGVSEDIITALSKLSKLFVVARSSTFTYKGRAVDVKQVGREQGVRYVLEGSVQRGGDRLRITAQLVDAQTGHHVWAQRYDRAVKDFFELQDEITREVTSALQVELTEGEQARLWASGTQNLQAWELAIQIPELLHSHRRADAVAGRRLAEQALRHDPGYATAWAMLGWAHWMDTFNGWTEDLGGALDRAVDALERARSIDDSNPDTLALLAFLHLSLHRYDEALEFVERAMALGPSNSMAPGVAANVAMFSGRPHDMEALLRRAMRLCPIYPAWYVGDLAFAYLFLDRLDEAISAAQETLKIDPDYIYTYYVLAIAYSELGQTKDAREAADNILRIEPKSAVGIIARTQPFQDAGMLDRMLEGLRKAGLPE